MPEEALTSFTACDAYRYFVGQKVGHEENI